MESRVRGGLKSGSPWRRGLWVGTRTLFLRKTGGLGGSRYTVSAVTRLPLKPGTAGYATRGIGSEPDRRGSCWSSGHPPRGMRTGDRFRGHQAGKGLCLQVPRCVTLPHHHNRPQQPPFSPQCAPLALDPGPPQPFLPL
ncbi:hypothetical protein HJG60_009705 [Phyllostomus discolor]|uniref:Uncharacterized protein n=1 Tax=Phyllostomus discolor TaxID=89673 RepID=A0A834BCE5_9CHIR|nr:hypothetical protein HJG60_009705 [Phyllostomus discolor]